LEDSSAKLNGVTANLKNNETNSQTTLGLGSNSTRTKEDEDSDLSFETDFFLDLPKDEEEVVV